MRSCIKSGLHGKYLSIVSVITTFFVLSNLNKYIWMRTLLVGLPFPKGFSKRIICYLVTESCPTLL